DEVASMVSAVRNKFGSITHLVCNAGISVTGLLEDMDLCQCDSVIDTNLKGVIYTVKEVIPDMVKRKSGVIVSVSSIWGKTGASCEAVYSASKAGVIAFSEAMAKELGLSGIRVNAVCPGCIDTDMMRKENFTACEMQTLIDETAIGRIGTPKDVADVVSFLLSDKSSFITGQAITVDGGFI
ncbi:MAG: SDR family oxidoreductase, partial [Eubacteriales bacterium]|nr:SDR family oxidoreductase [Eubacteriales bacterium]